MMAEIQEILYRRTDLSTFLVHLTRSHDGLSAKARLHAIYEGRLLKAGSAMGLANAQDDPDDPDRQSQRVVCFSEAPLEHAWMFTQEIEGRKVNLEPYGVAIPKYKGRQLGVNPVWYVDMTPGRTWHISQALDQLRDEAVAQGNFHDHPLAHILPFIELMGAWPSGSRREFWWEREWRKVGDLHLPGQGCIFMCPEAEIAEFVPQEKGEALADWNRRKRQFIDPRWGLERIIAHLAGMPRSFITPFAA